MATQEEWLKDSFMSINARFEEIKIQMKEQFGEIKKCIKELPCDEHVKEMQDIKETVIENRTRLSNGKDRSEALETQKYRDRGYYMKIWQLIAMVGGALAAFITGAIAYANLVK